VPLTKIEILLEINVFIENTELRRLIIRHGGISDNYQTHRITHFACDQFTDAQLKQISSKVRIKERMFRVTIAWILESISKGSKQPEANYSPDGIRGRDGSNILQMFSKANTGNNNDDEIVKNSATSNSEIYGAGKRDVINANVRQKHILDQSSSSSRMICENDGNRDGSSDCKSNRNTSSKKVSGTAINNHDNNDDEFKLNSCKQSDVTSDRSSSNGDGSGNHKDSYVADTDSKINLNISSNSYVNSASKSNISNYNEAVKNDSNYTINDSISGSERNNNVTLNNQDTNCTENFIGSNNAQNNLSLDNRMNNTIIKPTTIIQKQRQQQLNQPPPPPPPQMSKSNTRSIASAENEPARFLEQYFQQSRLHFIGETIMRMNEIVFLNVMVMKVISKRLILMQ
jgi:hypothetical protein